MEHVQCGNSTHRQHTLTPFPCRCANVLQRGVLCTLVSTCTRVVCGHVRCLLPPPCLPPPISSCAFDVRIQTRRKEEEDEPPCLYKKALMRSYDVPSSLKEGGGRGREGADVSPPSLAYFITDLPFPLLKETLLTVFPTASIHPTRTSSSRPSLPLSLPPFLILFLAGVPATRQGLLPSS